MAALWVLFCLIMSCMKEYVTPQDNTWKFDSTVTKQFPGGILSFFTTTDTILRCSRYCSRHDCSIFSFDEMLGSCRGYQEFAAANWSSSLVEPLASTVYHEGLDTVYASYGSLSLLLRTGNQEKVTYQTAKHLCSEVKGRLPIIDTDIKLAETLSIFGKRLIAFWIGLTDDVTEGTWLWENGKHLNYSPIPYILNNKDISAVESDQFNADCAVFNPKTMTIRDKNCHREYTVVCEKDPPLL